MKTLHPLIANGVMKMSTAENIAGSGLEYRHLKKIVERDGEDGLTDCFSAKNSEGKSRVTNSKKVLG